MDSWDILAIHFISEKDFVTRVKSIIEGNRNLVMLTLKISVIGDGNQVKVFALDILFAQPHSLKQDVADSHASIDTIADRPVSPSETLYGREFILDRSSLASSTDNCSHD